MWFFPSLKRRSSTPARRVPRSLRPRLEALEDRCTPSAGALDTTFGGTGVVTTSLKGGDAANVVLIQPWDGKIVLAGDSPGGRGTVMSLTRYNTDGTLDTSFGSGGKVVSKIGTNWWNAAALYPSTDTTGNAKKIVEAGAGSLTRFNPNGSTDPAFGNRGLVSVPFGIAGVVIQSDGKIVVGGDNGSAFELSRYNANGTLDTTFGSGGTASVSFGSSGGYSNALGLQADGKLVIAGDLGGGPGTAWQFARFNANGTLDTTFDSTGAVPGTVTITFAAGGGPLRSLAIYPGTGTDTADYGKIEAAGTIQGNPGGINSNQVALVRINADGTADGTFGQSGQVVTPFPTGGGMAWATALQVDGKILVAGQTYQYPGSGHWTFSLLRYNTNGSLDTSFGNGGIVTAPNGIGDSPARGVAIQPDGRIVAGGTTTPGSTGSAFMAARYLPGPEIGTFTTSASTVTAGSNLTLTASNLSDGDPGATITQVAFYAIDQSGNQHLLGAGTLSNGAWTLNYTASVAGSYRLFAQATDSAGIGDSAFLSLTINAGPATHFVLSAPANVVRGVPFYVTVMALDAYGNPASLYSGIIAVAATDPNATLPSPYAYDGDCFMFSMMFLTPGPQTITVDDIAIPAVDGIWSILVN